MMTYLGMTPFIIVGLWYVVDTLMGKKYLKKLKPLLMPLLILGLWAMTKEFNMIIAVGLLFGCFGDIFLMTDDLNGKNQRRFLLGVASFIIGHLCYIYYMVNILGNFSMTKITWLYLGTFVVVSLGFLVMLWRDLGKMKIPVIIYEIILVAVTVIAFTVFVNAMTLITASLWFGSMIFLASDAVLSFGIFKFEFKLYDFLVMSTYIIAQAMIGIGLW